MWVIKKLLVIEKKNKATGYGTSKCNNGLTHSVSIAFIKC